MLESLTHRQEGPRRDLLENLQQRQNEAELRKRVRLMHAARARSATPRVPPHGLAPGAARFGGYGIRRGDELSEALGSSDRTVFEDSIQYPEDSVGRYMGRELVVVPDTHSLEEVLIDLRQRGELPPQTDRVWVTDARHVLRGSVPLQVLLLRDPSSSVTSAMSDDTISFGPHDDARDAVKTFERYNLVSAPVVDERGKLVGRLTVDAAMDVLRDESNLRALKNAGLSGDEDLFAAPWSSARNRWPWLATNLLTAFVASRVIGRFEGTIERVAALAALMPVVASIGGNSGSRADLLVAALAGVTIPLALHSAGRDPAHGSSVLLTFITDAMGFFLFLGLATAFLL